MLSTETCSPVIRFRVCLDELLTSAHRMYAERALVPLSMQLTAALEREFGLSVVGSHGSDSAGGGNAPPSQKGMSTFKASWRSQVGSIIYRALVVSIHIVIVATSMPHLIITPTLYLACYVTYYHCHCREWILTVVIVRRYSSQQYVVLL